MKKGWEMKKLEEVCEVEYGTRVVNKRDGGSVYPVYGGGGATFLMDSYNREDQMVIARFAMSEQCTRFIKGKFFLNDSGLTIKPKDKTKILQDFLNLQILFLNDDIYSLARGTAQKNLDVPAFRNIEIRFPISLKEQEQIVSFLDEVFAAIDQAKENLQRNLQNAKELFQSELNRIFSSKGKGWTEKNLEEIALVFGRGKSKHRPRNDEKLYGGNYPFIQTGDVRNADKFITQYSQTYNEVGLAQSKLWQRGTICITIAANIAETGILTFDSCFPDSMIGLVVDPKKADVNFTYYALQFLKSALQLLGKGSAQDNINMGTFESQKFPFPSLEMQKEIVQRLDNLSNETKNLENIYQQKLNNLEELKKSILQKAFSGQLSESGFAGLKDEQDKGNKSNDGNKIRKILKSV